MVWLTDRSLSSYGIIDQCPFPSEVWLLLWLPLRLFAFCDRRWFMRCFLIFGRLVVSFTVCAASGCYLSDTSLHHCAYFAENCLHPCHAAAQILFIRTTDYCFAYFLAFLRRQRTSKEPPEHTPPCAPLPLSLLLPRPLRPGWSSPAAAAL